MVGSKLLFAVQDAIIILPGIYMLRREESAGERPIAYSGLTRRYDTDAMAPRRCAERPHK